jgi:hypothetical protein
MQVDVKSKTIVESVVITLTPDEAETLKFIVRYPDTLVEALKGVVSATNPELYRAKPLLYRLQENLPLQWKPKQ